ncbi:MAG TPA: Gfo/Idh/MocA family oxidoreductase, partial [Vicinamibacteria bacterium]|nr:Gfo/Idh/MocA family oxidoreductase [Vicinamibacteria bacterium]
MDDSRLNLVLLGCGRATATHGRTLGRFREQVRCFFASRDRDRAMAYERRFRGAGSFGSYEAALADGSMDVVLVCTPPASHLELTLAALESGKHVIVEKPAFPRARDFDVVRMAARASGKRVLVAENYAYKPLAVALRGLLAAGVVGDVRFVRVSAVKHQRCADWRDDAAQAGGGALFEGGVHWLDLLAHIGPKVRSIRAFRPGGARSTVERGMLVVLEYEDQSVGTRAVSRF